jgi:nucleotide-binding universal stress UspA family protein
MNLRKLLVGIDFSPLSDAALAHAMRIAERHHAEIILAHAGTVIDPAETALAPESAALVEYQKILLDHQADSRARLAAKAREVTALGLRASELLLDGFADSALVDGAEKVDADLVVLGTHGRTGLQRLLLGGVSERVVRLCRRHVLVTRAGGAPEGGYRNVLVATDFTPLGERSLDAAVSLCEPGGVVEVMHAWHLPAFTGGLVPGPMSDAALEPVRTSVEQGARDKLDAMIAARAERGVGLQITVVNQPPARAITERAEAGGHDLVVLGGHGRRGLRRWILGSVAEATVRHAPCSVLVIHEPPPPDE